MSINNRIVFHSVAKQFGDVKALDNFSLDVPEGKIFGLIGPNGAGKTTTIKCMTGLQDIDAGHIKIFGMDIADSKKNINIRERIGVLFENMDDLFVYLKGEEHLEFVGQVYGLSKDVIYERINDLFEYFEMESHRNILIDDYSKGMKKKIALSSIMLHNPEIIILDEPFEGLDTFTIIKVKKLLMDFKEKNKTIFITSHILSYIEDLCDDVAIINKGKIIFHSTTDKIHENFRKQNINDSNLSALEDIFLAHVDGESTYTQTLDWL